MHWDLFCRVIDNHGDLGVCWRLAADLSARGDRVRLRVDDASALAWMAPAGAPGVQVLPFDAPAAGAVGDVVVEAFGCDPPAAFVDAMAARRPAPVWINLEYLSAEDYVERSHGLASPVALARGLNKWFFYPGFTPRTGGVLREPGLLAERSRFDRSAWLRARGWSPRPGERLASLFGYDAPGLPAALGLLGDRPTCLLVPPGPLRQRVSAQALPPGLRLTEVPWLDQADYDRLLWSCDLNAVRGEDSFVRAQWAGAPFLWHLYPQHDGAHEAKLQAFLDRFTATASPALASAVAAAFRHWNGLGPRPAPLPDDAAWAGLAGCWRDRLAAMPDLTGTLRDFCRAKLAAAC